MPVTISVTATDAAHHTGTGTITGTPASTNVGVTSILSLVDNSNAGFMLGQQVVLSASGALQSLSFYTGNAIGNLKLALYNAAGPSGGPGQKLAETASVAAVTGWNTLNVLTQITLPSGTYWMVYEVSSNSLSFRRAGSSGKFVLANQTYGTMPATFPAFGTIKTDSWSFYMTVVVINFPPSTTTGIDPFWTVFTETAPSGEGSGFAGAGTRKIYVSSSTGNDSNLGTLASPKLTIAGGVALLRAGKPDWLLFKKGDTWTDQDFGNLSGFNGPSATSPMLFGAYGTGPRPLFKTQITTGLFQFYTGNCDNVAFVGLEGYSYQRDPNNSGFLSGSLDIEANGFISNATMAFLLIEDCKLRFYTDGIVVQGTTSVFKLRRSIVVDCYRNSATNHSEGMFIANVVNPTLEESIFDNDGWNGQIGGAASATIFNRNVYIHQDCGPATVTGNWQSGSSSEGLQLRTGGVMTGNFFYQNVTGFDVGHQLSEPAPTISSATVTDNVVMHSTDSRPGRGGYGIVVLNATTSGIQIHTNIMSHTDEVGVDGRGIYLDPDCSGCVVTNNIIFNWKNGVLDTGSDTTSPNAVDLAGANTAGYSAPNRDLGDYYLSIGGSNSASAFITAIRNQSKDTWNSRLTAKAAVNYIRAGFDLAPI